MFNEPKIMGILNATPDSFSDGNQLSGETRGQDEIFKIDIELAIQKIQQMIWEGAGIIDLGGESTGPGSKELSATEELNRVQPIIDWVAQSGLLETTLFSIDTYKASVAQYALSHGFQILNDVTALRGDEEMIDVLLKHKPYVVLMYAKEKTARTSTEALEYEDVIKTIMDFLKARVDLLLAKGFPKEKIILDPGMGGFISANPSYSFEVIERLAELKTLGFPLLLGISRKSFLGGPLKERDEASVLWSKKALKNGADIVRMHAVGKMQEALGLGSRL